MPLKSQINRSNIRYWIVGGFILAVAYGIPEVILQPLDQVQLGHNITGYICAVSYKNSVFADIYNGCMAFVISSYVLILLLLYLAIGQKLYSQSNTKLGLTTKDKKMSSKITKIAITVSIGYALSYIPVFIFKLLVNMII